VEVRPTAAQTRAYSGALAETLKARRLLLAKLSPHEHSLSAVARRTGIAQASLRDWESGRVRPRRPQLEGICRLLGLDPEELRALD